MSDQSELASTPRCYGEHKALGSSGKPRRWPTTYTKKANRVRMAWQAYPGQTHQGRIASFHAGPLFEPEAMQMGMACGRLRVRGRRRLRRQSSQLPTSLQPWSPRPKAGPEPLRDRASGACPKVRTSPLIASRCARAAVRLSAGLELGIASSRGRKPARGLPGGFDYERSKFGRRFGHSPKGIPPRLKCAVTSLGK